MHESNDLPSAEKEDPTVIRAYALVGFCAAQFARLEFHVGFSLSYFHMWKEMSVETVIFTRNAQLRDKLRLLKELITYRLKHRFPQLAAEGITIVDRIDKIRDERNLFIHGYWLINHFLTNEGIVNVSDTRWKYDSTDPAYSAMDTRKIKLSYLEALGRGVGEFITQLEDFRKKVDIATRSGAATEGDDARKR
jgi:hypothetical protein